MPSQDTVEQKTSTKVPRYIENDWRCLNCGTLLGGDYCQNCGQPADTRRISFYQIISDLLDHLISRDSKLFRTIGCLFTRPGKTALDYVKGNRVSYMNPLRYYLLVVAVNILVSELFAAANITSNTENPGFWDQHFVALQLSLVYGLLLLPLSFAHRFFYPERNYNIAENYAFLLYILAQSMIFIVILKPLNIIFSLNIEGDTEGLIWLGCFTLFLLWGGTQFYKQPVWKVAAKTIASYTVLLICMAVVGSLFFVF